MIRIVQYYQTSSGKRPLIEWLENIRDGKTRERIKRQIHKVELGNYGDWKPVGDGVYEIRLHFGSGYRIYFTEHGSIVVLLLCGGDKSTQKRDIKLAKEYAKDARKRAESS